MRTAIIAGATGLIGNLLLEKILVDTDFDSVLVISRKPLLINNPKLKTILCDFDKLETVAESISATHAFCCLGTTIKKAGSKEAQFTIDHDYVVRFGELCKQIGISHLGVISSLGANAQSSNFYLNTKGKMEESLKALQFNSLHIVRPSLLLGNRKELRMGEKISMAVFPLLSFLLVGPLKKYKAIKADIVAAFLLEQSKKSSSGITIFENNEIL